MNPLMLYGGIALFAALIGSNLYWWVDSKVLVHRIEAKDAEIGKLVVRSNALSEANDTCARDVTKVNAATAKLVASGAAGQRAANAAIGEVAKASAAAISSAMALAAQKPTGDLLADCKTANANIDAHLGGSK